MSDILRLYEQYQNVLSSFEERQNIYIENYTINFMHNLLEPIEEYFLSLKKYTNIAYPTSNNKIVQFEFGNIHISQNDTPSLILYRQIEEIINQFKSLEDDMQNPFRLYVMGIGNIGKSSLINSLIGTKERHAEEDS